MSILLNTFIIVAIISLILITVAIWYLVVKTVDTLKNIDKNMEKIADDMEKVLKNIDRVSEKVDNILNPIEKLVKISPILTFIWRFLPFKKK